MNASHNFAALEALNSKEINLNEYTFAQERFDERFGLVYYMKSKGSTKSLLVKERSRALTAEQFDEIYYRLQIVNDYLLKIYGVKQVVGSNTFQIYFEEFSTDLQAEIKRHLTEKTRFSEGELYAILYSAINALACLEQNQVSHDFLVPMNILKLSKDIYKLHDNYTLATKQHLYNHALRGQHKRYLAPELLDSLTHKREQPDEHDPHKADIYALGMCILDAGLLETEGDYIHKRLNILDEKGLNQALKRFEDLYSPAMRQILQDMLLQDPSYRPSASLLQRRLPGKPRLPGQPSSSAKKRKALDQLINSPDKNRSRNDPFLVRSPSRVHEDPFSPGYPSTDQRLLVVERSPPFEPNRLPQDFFSQPQPFGAYPEVVHNFEPSLSNVSPSIRSDPVLSKFINRGPEPIQQTIPQQFVQSPTPPVQGYPWHQPLSAQPNYSQQIGFPIHQDLYHDPYRTNLSYSSAPVQDVSTYRSSQSDYLQHSIHPQQVIRTSIPPSYQPHIAPSYGTLPGSYLAGGPTLGGPVFGGSMVGNPYEPRSPTKIDEMINRALERSSANLRSAQPGLDPIVERQVSEDYSSTPAGSKVLDPRASQNPNLQQGKK